MPTLARYTFYYGDKTHAQDMFNQLYQSKPDMPEAQLLQAEFDAKTGQPDAARRALTQRRNSPAGKGWMLSEAANIEGTIP